MLNETVYITAYICSGTGKLVYYLSRNKDGYVSDHGTVYVTVKAHEISVPEPTLTIDEYNALAVELLNESKKKVEAEAYVKVQAIEDKIQSFLALPAPVECEQDPYEDDIPF